MASTDVSLLGTTLGQEVDGGGACGGGAASRDSILSTNFVVNLKNKVERERERRAIRARSRAQSTLEKVTETSGRMETDAG